METYIEERRKFLIKVDKIEVIERISITQIIALPKIKELKMGSLGTMIMEKGKEYRQKVVYLMGVKDTISNSYIVTGHVIPNPHTSEAILLANSYEVIQEDFDRFIITSEKIAAFDLYKRKDNETIDDYIGKLCDNVVHSFIKIHGELRKDAIVANFLCFHSVLYFYLEGEIVNGWLQIACIGDTTTGKSRISKRIRDQFDIGVYVTGETCSRTGFLYAIDTKTLSICVLRFGLFAQQDRSILIIDGSNYISQEEWGSAREARRSGKLIIERIVKGEHPCRTRLILLANPAQSLSQYIHSVESIRDIFQEPDIARLDICLFFKKSDVSVNEINIPIAKREKPKVTISDKVLKDNILWAMSRQAEDIVIENDAVEAIYEVSTKLQNKFGGATDIPLISNDCKYKIGRIAVSLAALIHSTDDTHEKIIVTSEIVYAVERFVDRIYSASNCRYDEYAKNCKENTSVSDEEFEDIAVAFVLEQEKDRSNIFDELINILKKSNYAQLDALCAKLDKSSSTIKTKIALLKKYGLIRSGKSGYSKTEKFVHFLNLWGEKKALPSLSAQKEQTPYNNEQSSEEEDISDSGMGSDDNEPIKPIKPKPMEEKEDFRESIAVKIQAIRELNKDKKGEEDYEA